MNQPKWLRSDTNRNRTPAHSLIRSVQFDPYLVCVLVGAASIGYECMTSKRPNAGSQTLLIEFVVNLLHFTHT